jgi:hypothetical protein
MPASFSSRAVSRFLFYTRGGYFEPGISGELRDGQSESVIPTTGKDPGPIFPANRRASKLSDILQIAMSFSWIISRKILTT